MVCDADRGGGPDQSQVQRTLGESGNTGWGGGPMALAPRLERRAVPQGAGVREA